MTSLNAKQLNGLCAEVLPKIRTASTSAQQCTFQALNADAPDEASCTTAKQACLDGNAYDDWTMAVCADFTAADAGTLPHFACDTKVSEVSACFDKAATWLSGLSCKQADGTGPAAAPSCLSDLETGSCKFDIALLLKDTDFEASTTTGGSVCKDPSGDIPLDLGGGDACNACSTSHCCAPYVDCVNDNDCGCFAACPGTSAACYTQCGISADPPKFDEFVSCIMDQCSSECASVF